MENREILIANTKTQKRSKITTDATTLGELKAAMDAAFIDYSGMTFTEGISKTQLLSDATQLPQNIMYKGAPTNNLVILLTNTKKNIASGIGSRADAYQAIKRLDLQEQVKDEFGVNYTHVKTSELWDFIDKMTGDDNEDDYDEEDEDMEEQDDDNEDEDGEDLMEDSPEDGTFVDDILNLVSRLAHAGMLDKQELMSLADSIDDIADSMAGEHDLEPVSTSDNRITDDDINDMIDELDN